MPRDSLYLPTARDAAVASIAAFAGLPVSSVAWQFPRQSAGETVAGLAQMSGIEWAILIGVFVVPASMLGTAAAFILRRGGRRSVATGAAATVSFATAVLGLSAFYWYLSKVL